MRRCLALLLVTGLFLLTPLPAKALEADGSADPPATQDKEEYYELLKMFVDTLDQVERNYVQDISRRELLEAAIQGMLSKLDPHSSYIAPEDLQRFKSDVESEFGGIGIRVTKQRGELTIISPLVGSPAYEAGLMSGDVITHIEGERARPLGLDEAVKRLKGPLGTSVEITVRHPGEEGSRTVKLTREMVRIETVHGLARRDDNSWDFLLDPDEKVGYLRLTAFAPHTAGDLRKVLRELTDEGLRGLILDLRFNPGGLLSSAIHVSDLFVSEGRIVSTEGRNTEPQHWDAHRRGTFEGFPMAVLVNRYSASASEIVAACLQDRGRAVVIGERTFGKGSVQNIIELEEGRSALKLTTAAFIRPNGSAIDRPPGAAETEPWGVRPDQGFEVALSDAQTQQLGNSLHLRDNGGSAEGDAADSAHVDAALERARDYLLGQLSSELAAQVPVAGGEPE